MRDLSILLFVAVVFSAGCEKKGGADCTKAINHSMELSKAEMQKAGTDQTTLQKMTDLGIQHCKDDKWSAEAIKCMVDAKTMADAQACYGKLTTEQQDKMNKAATELAAPGGKTGSGAGSAVGSGSGSAAAGSAGANKLPNVDCAKAIPQSVADKYFKDIPPKHDQPSGSSEFRTDTTCRFVIDEKTNTKILIDYHCGGEFSDLDQYLAIQNQYLKVKYKRESGIGRGTFTDRISTYGVLHRSLPCMIMVDLSFLDDKDPLRKQDYMGLLRELEAALPDSP